MPQAQGELRAGDGYARNGAGDRLQSLLYALFIMRNITPDTLMFLQERGVLQRYAFIAFAFSFPSPSFDRQWTAEDYGRLHEWKADVIGKIVSASFSSFWPVVPAAGKNGILLYFVSGIAPDTWQALTAHLEEKARSASVMVTGLSPKLLKTPVFSGGDSLKEARATMEAGLASYYLGKEDACPAATLDAGPVFQQLEQAVASRDIPGSRACFSVIRNAIASSDHSLGQFMFIAIALDSALSSGLSSIGLAGDDSWRDAYAVLDYITVREEALAFIDDTADGILALLESIGGAGGGVADKAREYVMAHITERISLADVADYAGVSPGYMLKSFKRIMGISLVDYINTMKIGRAKEMMRQGGHGERIADIAMSLGFSNVYYFSKVFRKIEGVPPTEYLRKLR